MIEVIDVSCVAWSVTEFCYFVKLFVKKYWHKWTLKKLVYDDWFLTNRRGGIKIICF